MIEIRNVVVRQLTKYSNIAVIRFKGEDDGAYKKRSLRGTLSVSVEEDGKYSCALEIHENKKGRVSRDGDTLVRTAYHGEPGELDISFSTLSRFGVRLDPGEYEVLDLVNLENGATFKLPSSTAKVPQPINASNIDSVVDAIFDDVTTKAQIREMLTSLLVDRAAVVSPVNVQSPTPQPVVAKGKGGNRWGRFGIPMSERKKIQKALRTMSVREVSDQLGYSLGTIRRYAAKKAA